MIHVYGTSHVSQESMDLIEQKLEEHDPEIVALELDIGRLEALLTGNQSKDMPVFMRLMKKFQDHIGSKTGVMPGEEMLYAYNKCATEEREVALIDRDIRLTVQKLKQIPAKEKLRAFGSVLGGLFFSRDIDLGKIPDDELINELLRELKENFPELYRVLVEERNAFMTESLRNLQADNPDSDIVAFVGAAHRKDIEEALEDEDSAEAES